LLTLAPLFWAGNVIIGRAMRQDIPPVAMSFWRWTIAALILLPFTWRELWEQRRTVRQRLRVLALLGLFGVTCFNTLCYIGLQTTSATNGALLNSVVPVLIVVMSWLFLRERVRLRQGAGIALSLAGVVLIIARGDADVLLGLRFNTGDLWFLTAMVLWSFYTLLLRHKPATLSPHAFLASIVLLGLPPLALAYGAEVALCGAFALTPGTVATLGYFGLFPSVLAFLCFNRGVAALGPNRAGVFVHLLPVFGILLSALFLDERPHWYHLAGMLMVFCGIYLANSARAGLPAGGGD
jgi:drug/metabolite transporter (DMT)-like permease